MGLVIAALWLTACGTQRAAEVPTLMALPTSAPTQPPRVLNFWQPVTDTLSSPDDVHLWQFNGQQSDPVALRALGAGIVINLTLQGPDGQRLGAGSTIQTTLPATGLYTVSAQIAAEDSAASQGTYELGLAYTDRPNPADATFTPLPQVVGIPTPTPPYTNLGAFIAKINGGETTNGELTDSAPAHVYVFDGTAGQFVTLNLIRTSGTVDPVLTLYSPTGAPLATDDNSGGNRAALLRNIRLPEDGLYSIQASGDGFLGGYELSLTIGRTPQTVIPATPALEPTPTPFIEVLTPTLETVVSGSRLQDHVPVISALTREGDFNRFSIAGEYGQVVTIGASPVGESTIKLKLEVYGPAGELVASSTTSASNADGDVLVPPLRIESTGAYVVFVTAEDNKSMGQYSISYGVGSTRQNIRRGRAVQNQPNEGEISKRGSRDLWSVYLKAGDVITVAVSPSNNTLDPIVELTAADGALVAIDDNSGGNRSALISYAQIPVTGLYHLRVRAAQANSVGPYSLVWRYINTAPTPTPAPATLLILSVDSAAPDNTYLFYPFQGLAGQRVEIQVRAQPGSSFDPVAALLGPDGAVIAEADDGPDGSLNPRFIAQLPTDGTYMVRVNGYLRGGPFELTVEVLY